MALKVHRVVVVGCPRCVLTGDMDKLGVGKSCFCNRFVRPDSFQLHHPSRLSEDLWRDSPAYNGDHFLYWGAATKRHSDGTKTRFQVVEQTEFFDIAADGEVHAHRSQGGGEYIQRAAAAHFISRGKVAYKVYDEEEYAIPSSLKSNPKRSRAVQLFPNNEFSEGKGVSGFICLFDPTLEGQNIKTQFEFLTKLINEILKTKRKVVVACTKCDEVNEARIQFGANLVASIRSKKPIPFIQVSAKEGINIDEAFNYIVGQYNVKKKGSHKGGGKSSPILLGLPYTELVRSRGKDESYARATLNRIIHDKVTFFTAEWSSTWPYLQLDPKCSEAATVIGLTETKKIFCQRLMELKVAEVKGRSKNKPREKREEEKTRNCQSEILEAFSTHPDLINESAYDFVYTSSVPSFDTVSSSSPLSPASPLRPSSLNSPSNGSLPKPDSPVLLIKGTSPPPVVTTPPSDQMPSVCPEPGLISHYRTSTFSPSKTCLAVNSFASQQLNRSTEILATLPRVNVGLQRHSSLRYKNRTLPPLPAPRQRSETFKGCPKFLTKSQPHLEDTDEDKTLEINENSPPVPGRIKRRLSNSMECLKSSSSIADPIEASPYISPVNVQAVLAANKKPSGLVTSSVRVPPQTRGYPSLPDGFLTLGRNGSQYERDQAKSTPRLFDGPVCMMTKPRSSSSPPPPPPLSILDGPNPVCLLSPKDETSLDIRGDTCWFRGPVGGASILEGEDSTEDDVSIISGPFAEVEEPDCLPPLMSEIKKSHESLSKMPSNFVAPLTATPTTTASDSSLADKHSESDGDKVEGIYASIPGAVDEEYLTMKSGVSLDDLLNNTPTKGVNTAPLPSAKSVIKKLQMFAHTKSDVEMLSVRRSESPSLTPKASPNKVKKISNTSIQSVPVARHSIDSMDLSSSLNRGGFRSTMFNRRPLPQSPTKIRKVSSISGQGQMKRKSSMNDSKNIYETIDGEHAADWLKQMKSGKPAGEDDRMSSDLERVLDHFLSNPTVMEHWRASVRSVYPEFMFPDTKTVPPLVINPTYFEYRSRSQSIERIDEEDKQEIMEDQKDEQQQQEDEVVVTNDGPDQSSHLQALPRAKVTKKESFTDVVLARLNQRLLMHQESTSSSEGEESEEEDDDETYSETSSVEGEYEVNNGGSSVRRNLSIREQFNRDSEINENMIVIDSAPPPSDQQLDSTVNKADILNGITRFGIDPSSSSMWSPSTDSAPLWTTPTHKHNPASWTPPTAQQNDHITKVYINDDEESGTGSSSPTGPDPPGDGPIISSVIHPTPIKNTNNHLSVCHFNSMDSGISANGNATSVDVDHV